MPSIFVFTSTSLLRSLTETECQGNFGKFQRFRESRFRGLEKDRYFLKIPKWQHTLVRDYRRGKLVSYLLNNAAKTCLYGDWNWTRTHNHLVRNVVRNLEATTT